MNTVPPLPLVIEPQDLYASLGQDNLLVIDLACQEETYQQGHVPGAVYLPSAALLSGAQPNPAMLPNDAQLQRLADYLGIDDNLQIVVYDDEGGGWAGRMVWTLEMMGYSNYSYLNGGIHAWHADGLATETRVNLPFSRPATISPNSSDRISKTEILHALNDPELVIWDARSPGEYSGEKRHADRAGHIPGAVNFEWTRGMNLENQFRLRDLDILRHELAQLGITADKKIITHCQTHHRSGFTYMLGKILGFPHIRAYDGSWSEWGNDPNTPVETRNK